MPDRLPFGEELRAKLGEPSNVRRLHSSPRSRVWLVELAGERAIVKQITRRGRLPVARYERETAALRLAGRATPAVAPALLGTDDSERVLVLEFLERCHPGPDWPVAYAEALARLHATTGPGDAGALPLWQAPGTADAEAFLRFAAALGIGDRAAEDELTGLVARLGAVGWFALLHGDPCPGNDLHLGGGGVRFVDYEAASLGNGLQELAYLRIGFPTCWSASALPPALLDEAEAAYRRAWQATTGAPVEGSLADACAGWLIRGDSLVEAAHRGKADQLARAVRQDWDWGPPTARERLVYRLGVVASLAGDESGLGAFGRFAAALRTRMLARWPSLRPLPSTRDPRCDLT